MGPLSRQGVLNTLSMSPGSGEGILKGGEALLPCQEWVRFKGGTSWLVRTELRPEAMANAKNAASTRRKLGAKAARMHERKGRTCLKEECGGCYQIHTVRAGGKSEKILALGHKVGFNRSCSHQQNKKKRLSGQGWCRFEGRRARNCRMFTATSTTSKVLLFLSWVPHLHKLASIMGSSGWEQLGECWRHGGSLHSQVEHHVRDKFAAPILYGIDNPSIMMFFYIYITIDNIFCIYFWKFLAILIF
jgi:hypothetical protein